MFGLRHVVDYHNLQPAVTLLFSGVAAGFSDMDSTLNFKLSKSDAEVEVCESSQFTAVTLLFSGIPVGLSGTDSTLKGLNGLISENSCKIDLPFSSSKKSELVSPKQVQNSLNSCLPQHP